MLIPILIFSVLAIALIFFLIKSAETWNWVPITMIALIFLTGIFAGIAASRSLKMRRAWKAQYLSNEIALDKAKSDWNLAIYGPNDTVAGYGDGSLRDASLKLQLAGIGNGRFWVNGTPVRSGEEFTVTYNLAEGQTSPTEQIVQDMRLFAFEASDRVIDPGGDAPPAAFFVGSFKVVSVNQANNSLTLQPIFLTKFFDTGSLMRQLSAELSAAEPNPDRVSRLYIELGMELAEEAKAEFQPIWDNARESADMSPVVAWLDNKSTEFEATNTWDLFEKMPGDSRTAFMDHAGFEPFGDDNPATPEKLAEWRNLLATVYLTPDVVGLDPESAEYEFLLDQYTFDGARVNNINQYINQNAGTRISDRFEMLDDSDNLYVKIRFTKGSESFTVDGTGRMETDGAFGINGAANDPDLKLNKTVELPKDSEINIPKGPAEIGNPISDSESGPSVSARNDAESLKVEYFKRPLRDYPLQLAEFRNLTRKAINNRRAIETDIEITNKIIQDAKDQDRVRSQMIADLRADTESMQAALNEINRLVDLRSAQLAQCKADIRTYYNQIIELYRASEPSPEFLDTRNEAPSGGLVR